MLVDFSDGFWSFCQNDFHFLFILENGISIIQFKYKIIPCLCFIITTLGGQYKEANVVNIPVA